MGLRFIIGRAGTGKTTLCMEEIIAQQNTGKKRQVLIVPEQFTSQAERDLIEKTGQNAILTAEVLSFGRLAHRVFSKKGIGSRIPLGDIGKSMALRKILLQEKEQISYFQSVMDKPGFIDQLGLTLSEFFQYRISPEMTEELSLSENLSHGAREKLKDLTHIHRSYLEFLKQEYISADETLGLLAERLDDSLGFSDTEFWLDGFYGFTPQEYDVIRRLLQVSPQVNITLTMDENSFRGAFLPPSAPFYEPYMTKKKLTALAEELGLTPVAPTILKENRRAETDALKNLEKEYFYSFFRKAPLTESVHITACPNLQEEIRFAAGKILRLVREEQIRFRDIAIVTNAMEVYEKNLRGILAEYDIPYFIDARRETASHPLVSLLTALLDILVYDFKYDAMFAYLKSGLTPLTTEEIDILENYVLAYGIKGYKWKLEYWDYGLVREGAEAIEAINGLREKIMLPFAPFLNLPKTASFHTFIHLILQHLDTIQAAEILENWANEAAAEGNLNRAEEYRQIWQLVMDVLEKADAILGKEALTLPEMAKILEAGLEKCTMGVIPPTADSLLIGDLERSRLPEDVLNECRELIANGCREITLLGQNVNSYGKDLGLGVDFADLLAQIAQLPGDFLIRFMTSHPRDASKKLFDTMAKYPKIAKQLHLPFQSGSSRVLKAMNRHYDRETYLEKVNYAKSIMPDLVLTSDVIVGFPGETEEEFEETISLIEAVHYDSLFTFIFSPRPGTPAAKMEDPTPKEEKSRRFDRLCDVQNRISVEIHNNYVGKTMRCLVDGKDKDMLTARTEGGRLVRFAGCDSLIGTYQNVTITGATTWSLTGTL